MARESHGQHRWRHPASRRPRWGQGAEGFGHPHPLSPFQRYKVQFNKGEHGFDNEAMNMKTIFRAVGPAFKRGLVVEPFESVNVYALLCELLGITPEPHDGSLDAVKPMLRESRGHPPPVPGPPALRRDSRGDSDTWRLPPLPLPPPSGGSGHRRGPGILPRPRRRLLVSAALPPRLPHRAACGSSCPVPFPPLRSAGSATGQGSL